MPFLEDTSKFGLPFRSGVGAETPEPLKGSIREAAFEMENEIGAGYVWATRPRDFPPVDGYSPYTDTEDGFDKSEMVVRRADRFMGVNSPAERRAMQHTIEREERNDKLLDQAGGWGQLARIGAGMASPTVFLPGGAIYRSAKVGERAAKSALSVGTAALGGIAVQEAALQALTETRTASDTAVALVGGAAFGGILGGALGTAFGRTAAGADAVGVVVDPGSHYAPLVGGERSSVSAAAVDDLDTTLKQGWGGAWLSNWLKFTTPLTRGQNSISEAMRLNVARLTDPGGTALKANTAEGGNRAVVPGGSVEVRVRMDIDAIDTGFRRELDEIYGRYYRAATGGDGAPSKIGMAVNSVKKALGRDGPMSLAEFSQATTIAHRTNRAVDADPHIQEAAKLFEENINKVTDIAVRAGVVDPEDAKAFRENNAKHAAGYVPRMYIARQIAAKMNDWVDAVFEGMKIDQDKKALLQQRAVQAADDMSTLEKEQKRIGGRQTTVQGRLADVEARINEVRMASKRGDERLYKADARVADLEEQIADLQSSLSEAQGSKDYSAKDLKNINKELGVLRKARDKALRDAAKGAPEAPMEYSNVPAGQLPESFNPSRFLSYLTGDRGPPKEPNFIRWLISIGGVKDTGGEVSNIFGGKPPRGLIKSDGMELDTLGTRYGEQVGIENNLDGQVGNKYEPNDTLDFIASAERGEHPPGWVESFPQELQQRLMEYKYAQEVAGDMRAKGLNPEDKQQAIAHLVGDDGPIPGKPMTEDDLAAMGDIPLDPVETFRGAVAHDTAADVAKNVKESERAMRTLRNKIAAREKSGARASGVQGEAQVNARASQSRTNTLLDRAEFHAARDSAFTDLLEDLAAKSGDVRGKLERLITEWEGDTTKAAKSALTRRTAQEAERQKAIDAGTYKGRGGRLASADSEVDSAIKAIAKSDRGKIDAELRTQAQDVVQNLISTPGGRLPYEWGSTATKESRATAGMPGKEVSKFLRERKLPLADSKLVELGGVESDARTILGAYLHSMIPQAEMSRMFDGDIYGTGAIRAIEEEYTKLILEAPTEKQKGDLRKAMAGDIRDFTGMRDRILGTYAVPIDPDSFFHRGATIAKQFQFLSKLGSMIISQIVDMGMMPMRYGMGSSFDAFAGSLARFSKDPAVKKIYKLERQILEDSAIGVDMVKGLRDLGDVLQPYGSRSKFENVMDASTGVYAKINLSRQWDAGMQTIAGIAALRRLMRSVEQWATTGATPHAEWLAIHNIGLDEAKRIWAAASAGEGERMAGVLIPEGRSWKGPAGQEAYEMVRVALRQAVDSTIIKPGQDKSLFASTPHGSLLFQFKSFIVSAQQRVLISGLQQADANVVQGAIMMFGLGMLSVALRDLARDGKLKERTPAEWMVNGFDHSGLSAWLMDANNMAGKISGGTVSLQALAGQEPASRYQSRSPLEAALGPVAGGGADMIRAVGGVMSGEPTRSDVRSFRNQVPTQNHFLFRGAWNRMQEGVEAALGIPARPADR